MLGPEGGICRKPRKDMHSCALRVQAAALLCADVRRNALFATGLLHRASWPTRQHARTAIFQYLEGFYNRQRSHSTLGYRSPIDFEGDHLAIPLAA
jgi:transposase InsO family protein